MSPELLKQQGHEAANEARALTGDANEISGAPTACALDPRAQISLFGKLKLMNCANSARLGNHAGYLFDQCGTIGPPDDCGGNPLWALTVTASAGRPRGRSASPVIRLIFPVIRG